VGALVPADFSHLLRLHVEGGRTSAFELSDVHGNPVLHGVLAGEPNKPYFNALLKRSAKKRLRAGKPVTVDEVKENRDHDRDLFPRMVLKRWERVVDSAGQPVPFNEENCRAFLGMLPDHIFDSVRNHFADHQNFVTNDDPVIDQGEAEELGN
jgi:hypothetical protein